MGLITGINHVTFSVRNLEESFHFYKNILGLTPVMRSAHSAYFSAGNDWIALVEDNQVRQQALPEYTHLAFSVAPEDFNRLAETIIQSGACIWQENESEGLSLYFLDPNGYQLEIHASDLTARLQAKKQSGEAIEFWG